MKKVISIVLAAVLALSASFLCNASEKTNRALFNKVYSEVSAYADAPYGELVTRIGKAFLGTPYVASTLEIEPESLQVFLDKTDCILYVELCNCFALTVKGLEIVQQSDGVHYGMRSTPSVKKAEPSYELLCSNIRNMRYRRGIVDGYASRIHYTSEWLLQNQTNGLLREFTSEIGEPVDQKFSYMSTHADRYRQLAKSPETVDRIAEVERNIESYAPFFYISQERLRDPEVMAQIHDGDIITFMSRTPGLDLAHVAIACRKNGEMHFLHASYAKKKVVLEEKTLADYATNGLRVSRILVGDTKPVLIGISTSHSANGSNSTGDSYVEAVVKGGGVPVLLPLVHDAAMAREMVAAVDGVLFTGGEDFDPAWYGEAVLNETVGINSARDTSDLMIAREAIAQKKAILGICRGEQCLNVALGGSLYQDLPSQAPSEIAHKQKEPSSQPTHAVIVDRNSRLCMIMHSDSLMANSHHHEAVKVPGEGIVVTGRAVDGVVEAYEAPGIMAVQFHPEKLIQGGSDVFLPVFVDFVQRARRMR